MNIFLDDERNPSDVFWIQLPDVVWTITRTPDSFIDLIKNNSMKIKTISIDNDIQHVLEGYHLLKIICDMDIDNDYNLLRNDMIVYAHTMNNVNRQPILDYWSNYLNHKIAQKVLS